MAKEISWPGLPVSASGLVTKGSLVVNVADAPYGAVGDGVADDTAAIQAAITAAASARGSVLLPAVHKVTATINVPANVEVRALGASAKVSVPAGFNFPVFKIDGVTARITGVRIIKASGANAGANGYGVQILGNSDGASITDVYVEGMCAGFYVAGELGAVPGTAKRVTLTRCYAKDSLNFGFEIDNCDGVELTSCVSNGSGLDGAKLRRMTKNVVVTGGYFTGAVGGDGMDCFAGGNTFTIMGTTFSGNTINGITIKSDSLNKDDPATYGYVGNVTATGLRCNNNGGYGLTFHRHGSTDDPTIPLPVRCTVSGGNFSGNTCAGIFVLGRQVTLAGVQCARNGQDGIYVAQNSIDVSLVGVQCSGNSQTTPNTYSGIRVAGDRVQVSGGWSIGADADLIRDEVDLAAATRTQKYGLEITATASNVDVNSPFRARYNLTANFLDNGTQTTRYMPGVAQMPSPGRYMVQGFGSRTTLGMVQDVEYATPIVIGEGGTVVRIAAEVTAVGGGSSVVRLALRKNANNFPGALIGQTTISGTSATVQEQTVSWDIPVPGVYWLTATGQGGTPSVRAVTGNAAPVSWSTLANAFSATPLCGYITAATSSGVLTDSYVINNRAGVVPLIALRF